MKIVLNAGLILLAVFVGVSAGDDWPVYMGNNSRTGVTEEEIQFSEKPLWVYHAGKPSRGFYPELKKTKGPQWIKARTSVFDYAPSPVISGNRVFIPSSSGQSVICLSVETGSKEWEWYTSGAVRFAPAVTANGIVFGSDDGFVYCISMDGKLKWKYRASPDNRTIIADGQLSSSHPIRTGLIEYEGLIYGAGGLFPESGGVYLFCLDGPSGKLKWKQNILVPAIGYLFIEDDVIFVPTGRSSPVEYSLKDGTPIVLTRYEPRREGGGSVIWQCGEFLAYGPNEFGVLKFRTAREEDMEKKYYRSVFQKIRGNISGISGTRILFDNDVYYLLRSTGLDAVKKEVFEKSLKQSAYELRKRTEKRVVVRKSMVQMKGDRQAEKEISDGTTWTAEIAEAFSMIKAGNLIVLGRKNRIAAFDSVTGKETWSADVKGIVYELAAAGEKLFAGTDQGMLYCFGKGEQSSLKSAWIPPPKIEENDSIITCLNELDRTYGYCSVVGDKDGSITLNILNYSNFNVTVFCDTPERVEIIRKIFRMDLICENRQRAIMLMDKKGRIPFPDNAANLVVVGDGFPVPKGEIDRILHPYEGYILHVGKDESHFLKADKKTEGLGNWTHMFADAANTSCSGDTVIGGEEYRVQWFGAPYAEDDVGWHANGMSPLYKDGRLFAIYVDKLKCIDAYNGTQLWEQDITGSVRFSPGREGGNAFVDASRIYVTFDSDVRV